MIVIKLKIISVLYLFSAALSISSEECIPSGVECNFKGDNINCCNPKERCVIKEKIVNGTSGFICSLPALNCKKNHFEKNRSCVPMVGAKCKKSLCHGLDHLVCRNRKCRCKRNYFPSEDNKACFPYTLRVGTFCANNKSCERIKFSKCKDSKCQCSDGYSLTNGRCLPKLRGAPCNSDDECSHSNGLCISGICDCFHQFSNFDDRCPPINFSKCSAEEPCIIRNSNCHPLVKMCLCNESYVSNLRGVACEKPLRFKPFYHRAMTNSAMV